MSMKCENIYELLEHFLLDKLTADPRLVYKSIFYKFEIMQLHC